MMGGPEVVPLDAEFFKWFATLGVGGILAAFMFVFYRKDVRQYTDLWKVQSDQLIQVVKENTISNQRLVSLIETQERNQFRKSDLEMLLTELRSKPAG
jgi:hypothetical protein